MKFLGGIIEISSISNTKYPGDTSGNSMVATLKGSAEKGETAQVYGMPGFIGRPPKGSKGVRFRIGSVDIIIGTLNYLVPLPDEYGETKVYSTDEDGSEQSTIKLIPDGTIEINGNTDFAVRFSELEAMVIDLNTKFDAHVHPDPSSGSTGIPTVPLGLDISLAKVDEVKLP